MNDHKNVVSNKLDIEITNCYSIINILNNELKELNKKLSTEISSYQQYVETKKGIYEHFLELLQEVRPYVKRS